MNAPREDGRIIDCLGQLEPTRSVPPKVTTVTRRKLATVQCFVAQVVGTLSQIHGKVVMLVGDLEENFAPLCTVVDELQELAVSYGISEAKVADAAKKRLVGLGPQSRLIALIEKQAKARGHGEDMS